MPPPPPPSKSYLLVLDDVTSSEDERRSHNDDGDDWAESFLLEEEFEHRPDNNNEGNIIKHENTAAEQHGNDDDDDDDDTSPISSSPRPSSHNNNNTKKRRKRKNKKHKKRNHHHHQSNMCNNKNNKPAMRKEVSFGSVHTHEFGRCLGASVVPGDGGWPLGLEVTTPPETPSRKTPIDDYEQSKQERLKERWNAVFPEEPLPPPDALETRQYDYKRKQKNPLFGMLTEKERMQILLSHHRSSSTDENDDLSISPAAASPKQHARKTRSRTSRSNSFSSSLQNEEQYTDVFSQVEVHHVRNELETIRLARDGGAGCQCRKLHVYLLPSSSSDNGANCKSTTTTRSKKANKQRMSLQNVKQELRKRGLLPVEHKTREELEVLLHDAVEQEPCCTDQSCFCVRHQLECQADTCSCWLASHQAPKNKSSSNNGNGVNDDACCSVQEIQARCGNQYGMYVVDVAAIADFRNQFLCQEVSTPSEP